MLTLEDKIPCPCCGLDISVHEDLLRKPFSEMLDGKQTKDHDGNNSSDQEIAGNEKR